MKLFYLLSSLNYSSAARQALRLGEAFTPQLSMRVGVLRDEGPWAGRLRDAGAAVASLGWNRALDPLPLWRLHRQLRDFDPDCIHVWRWPALRSLALAGRKYLSRCVVSQVGPRTSRPKLTKFDGWLLRRVQTIVASSEWEAESLTRSGINHRQLTVIPPSVEIEGRHSRYFDGDSGERTIVCLGNVATNKGYRHACQALDFLAYPFADLRLKFIGTGPDLPALKRFQERSVFHRDRIDFLGASPEASEYLATADICWVPSLTATGMQVALEAMAAARPVVASDLPPFREIIEDRVSGFLVPPGDVMALIRRSRELLHDPALRARLGEAAQNRVKYGFAAADFIDSFRALYRAGQPNRFPQNDYNASTAVLATEE